MPQISDNRLVNFESCQKSGFHADGMILRNAALLYIKAEDATLGDPETARRDQVSR